MSDRLSAEQVERLLIRCHSFESGERGKARETIQKALRSAYLEADQSVFLREALGDLNRKLVDAELERDRYREKARILDDEVRELRPSTQPTDDTTETEQSNG